MEKLKKYYQHTDALVYTISTSKFHIFFIFMLILLYTYYSYLVLDPRLKLTYHYDHNWEEQYITQARNDITELYNKIYAPTISNPIEEDDDPVEDNFLNHVYKKRRRSRSESELESYLGCPIVDAKIDLLQWWKV